MYPGTKFEIIEHGGESYFAAVRRRDAILVNPAGVVPVAKSNGSERSKSHCSAPEVPKAADATGDTRYRL